MFILIFVGLSVISLSIYLYSYINLPKMKYIGSHVLVTGGSSGIGLEVAKGFFIYLL